jgi:hypothetical protein
VFFSLVKLIVFLYTTPTQVFLERSLPFRLDTERYSGFEAFSRTSPPYSRPSGGGQFVCLEKPELEQYINMIIVLIPCKLILLGEVDMCFVKKYRLYFCYFYFFMCIFYVQNIFAQLRIDSTYPSLGVLGQDLEVSILGKDFDKNSRIAMYMDSGNKFSILGFANLEGSVNHVEISGDFAYVCTRDQGLTIIDVKNKEKPFVVNKIGDWIQIEDICVRNGIAFVLELQGIRILNVSNPIMPEEFGFIDVSGNEIEWAGDYLYVACGSGLKIFDVSEPINPLSISTVSIPGSSHDIKISNNKAYVITVKDSPSMISYHSYIHIIDISEPNIPRNLGVLDTSITFENSIGKKLKMQISDGIAYVAHQSAGLCIFHVGDPKNPYVLSWLDLTSMADDVFLSENNRYLYVADTGYGLHVVDVSDLHAPKVINSVATPSYAEALTVIGNNLYIAGDTRNSINGDKRGFHIIDIENHQNSSIVGSADTPYFASEVIKSKDALFVYDSPYEIYAEKLHMFQEKSKNQWEIIETIDVPGYVGMNLFDDLLILLENDALKIVDFSASGFPVMVEVMDMPVYPTLSGKNLFGFHRDDETGKEVFVSFDMSNPYVPKRLGSLLMPDDFSVHSLEISGGYAYIGLRISSSMGNNAICLCSIDISDPSNMEFAGQFDKNVIEATVSDIAIVGDVGCLAGDLFPYLRLVDLSDPKNIKMLGYYDTYPGWIKSFGSMVYVSGLDTRIHVLDVADPQHPVYLCTLDTPGWAQDIFVADNLAYIADGLNGLSILPIPIEIEDIQIKSACAIKMTLPSPPTAGHYTLRVFSNTGDEYESPGSVTFVESDSKRVTAKAIIAAGQGRYDNVWPETQMLADHAYRTLKMQGYTDERIQFLSANPAADGVDGYASPAALADAITQWAKDASGLFIYLVGHGQEGVFHPNPLQAISAESLSNSIDNLQANMDGQVFVVYDACESGSFLPYLSYPEKRIVITSGSSERSWMYDYGYTSFSYAFWDAINEDANIYRAFQAGQELMSPYQTANLDANGNGKGNEPEDFSYIATELVGRGRVLNRSSSPIVSVMPPVTLYGDADVTLWADVPMAAARDIERVWAVVVAPDDPTRRTEQTLVDTDNDGRFESDFSGFPVKGTYVASIYAMTSAGDLWYEFTSITQTVGIDPFAPDAYEPDGDPSHASTILVDDPESQQRNFFEFGDQDWLRFFAAEGQTYEIRAKNLAPATDAILRLYDVDGTTLLEERNIRGAGGDESLQWTCPGEGLYFARITNAAPSVFGGTIRYEAEIILPYLSDAGFIEGVVRDSGGYLVSDARIKTDGGGANLSRSDGTYFLKHRTGAFTLSAEADGYDPYQNPVSVGAFSILNHDIALSGVGTVIEGDLNKDKSVNIADAMLALKVLAGQTEFSPPIFLLADVDGNGRIGLEEAIYALRIAANLP